MTHALADACNPAIPGCKPESAYSSPFAFILIVVVVVVIAIAGTLLVWIYVRRRSAARFRTRGGEQAGLPQAVAGWFPDPNRRFAVRYWDGSGWTESVSNGTAIETDPMRLSRG